MAKEIPELASCVDETRVENPEYERLLRLGRQTDFSAERRGNSYRRAQADPMVRATGIRQLLMLLAPQETGKFAPDHKILDVLGGDGVVTRALPKIFPQDEIPFVVTSDLDHDMVEAARAYGLPVLWQPAEYLILKGESMDGVLMAYGSHHIDSVNRPRVVAEAFRVLKSGGRFVLHDFEEGSINADWFKNVVDKYSATGHNCRHFTTGEMTELLSDAGFTSVRIRHILDPLTMMGESDDVLSAKLAEYILDMYGLTKLREEHGEILARKKILEISPVYVGESIENKVGLPRKAEMFRLALVASGTKR
ncbi:MAG: ubiquinone/menaquinone biosynthesis methylase [Microgenomates group bacterium Gr01-1014_7]|nr:MAG: ubiquinone/menaquinone biosynthesis methylase [Microgenomates group bacterium Gr01-1014_7]